MQVTRTKCETCPKETTDHYDEPGWIQLGDSSNTTSICISKGRNKVNRAAVNGFRQFKVVDFCGEKCLAKWIKLVRESK